MAPDERKAVKTWLRDLREKRDYTQKELAELVGTSPRTILNAEAEDQGFPNGWTMLRLLQELGAVVDAPVVRDDSLSGRLEALEAQVAAGFRDTTGSIAALSLAVEGLGQQEPPQAAPKRRAK